MCFRLIPPLVPENSRACDGGEKAMGVRIVRIMRNKWKQSERIKQSEFEIAYTEKIRG